MTDTITIKGTVETIIFLNEENSYAVFSLLYDEGTETVCTGVIPAITLGETISVTGTYITHHTYGPQLNIKSYKKFYPTSSLSIQKYLASGAIKGIGEKLASRIIQRFGDDTLKTIEEDPQALAMVKGISSDMAKKISEDFSEQSEMRKVFLNLSEYDITPLQSMKIYKKYKSHTIDVVKQNPYILSSDIVGIGFKIADKIALKIGIEVFSPYRIRAGVKYILSQCGSNGDVCIEKEDLLTQTATLLSIDKSHIDNCLIEMQLEQSLFQEKIEDKILVYGSHFYKAESYVSKKLITLSLSEVTNGEHELSQLQKNIKEAESFLKIRLASEQREAVTYALTKGMLVITGGPGTGKTTIIKTIITLLQQEGATVELAAPTGRAAKRMTEATGIEAKTIHRLLGVNFISEGLRQTFEKNEENPIEADVIIIDETSMVDLILMQYLLKAVSYSSRLILVGDANQLPSVGAGNVLRDIISSGKLTVISLKEVFRQAKQSLIVTNAHNINLGLYPALNEKDGDFFFLRRNTQQDVVNTILELCTNRLISYGFLKEDIQVLCPMRKSFIGASNLNTTLQSGLNPHSNTKNEVEYRGTTFRCGDKVMQLKNNYNLEWEQTIDNIKITGHGIFNGDEGYIISVNKKLEFIEVEFYDKKIVNYSFKQLDEITLSYAITIHKAQGSEYPAVVIPIYSGPPMLHNRNLLYTALTRAKKLAVFVGSENALQRMIDNNKEIVRNSYLWYRIKKLSKVLDESDK